MLLISVVVPVFNSERFLSECIHSILDQTYRNLEIIIVDDGSKDNSGIICDIFAKTDNRIRVFHNDNNGANRSRAFGVKQATGDFVLFVDSDDTIPEYAVEEFVSNSNEVDIVVGFPWESPGPKRVISIEDWRKTCAVGGYLMLATAKLFRRKILVDNVFDIPSSIKVCEDDLMNLKIALSAEKNVVILQRQCYYYNKKNETSITSTFEWTFQYLEYFCNVYRKVIPSEFENELIPPFTSRRIKAVHNLISDSSFHKIKGMKGAALINSIKHDSSICSFSLSKWDILTLDNPDSFLIWGAHHLIKKLIIGSEYLKRKFL